MERKTRPGVHTFKPEPAGTDVAAEVVEALLGNLDGTITRAESRGLAEAFGVSVVIGLGLAGTLALTGTPLRDAAEVGRYAPLSVGSACILRLVADILKLGRWAMALLDAVQDHRDSQEEPPPGPGANISITVPKGDRSVKFLSFEGQEGMRVLKFARVYLANYDSKAVDYPEAERLYVGPGSDKPWSRGDADYARWQEFKRRMIDSGLAIEQGNRWRITERGRRALRELVLVAHKEGL